MSPSDITYGYKQFDEYTKYFIVSISRSKKLNMGEIENGDAGSGRREPAKSEVGAGRVVPLCSRPLLGP